MIEAFIIFSCIVFGYAAGLMQKTMQTDRQIENQEQEIKHLREWLARELKRNRSALSETSGPPPFKIRFNNPPTAELK